MRRSLLNKLWIVFVILLIITICFIKKETLYYKLFLNRVSRTNYNHDLSLPQARNELKSENKVSKSILALVVCDESYRDFVNVVKSVLVFTDSPVHFIIFTEDNLKSQINQTLHEWKQLLKGKQFQYELRKVQFPKDHEDAWLNLFKKCSSQRLFLPDLLPEVDSLIYTDTDTLFLGPIDHLWQYFYKFNDSQIAAATFEDDNTSRTWYPRFAKHPYYGKYGLNTGVMLMNLTRMRDFGWEKYLTPIMLQWRLNIPWGDQDIINIIFHYHPDAMSVLPCELNFRTDQCMYGDGCERARQNGVYILHGSRNAFHRKQHNVFRSIDRAFTKHNLSHDPPEDVVRTMEKYITHSPESNCKALKESFLRFPKKTFNIV